MNVINPVEIRSAPLQFNAMLPATNSNSRIRNKRRRMRQNKPTNSTGVSAIQARLLRAQTELPEDIKIVSKKIEQQNTCREAPITQPSKCHKLYHVEARAPVVSPACKQSQLPPANYKVLPPFVRKNSMVEQETNVPVTCVNLVQDAELNPAATKLVNSSSAALQRCKERVRIEREKLKQISNKKL